MATAATISANSTQLSTNRSGYIPTLDGWRCIAIVGVLLFHDNLRHVGPISSSLPHKFGFLGVSLFFAISGFLITSRLLDEESTLGSFSASRFYLRRAFRILPPLCAYLLVLTILRHTISFPVAYQGIFAALDFVRNFSGATGKPLWDWFTGHCWTLSIEEQFYLVLPVTLAIVHSRRQRLLIIGALAGFFSAYRAYLAPHFLDGFYAGGRMNHSELHVSGLLLGTYLAVLVRSPLRLQAAKKILNPYILVLAIAVLVSFLFFFPEAHHSHFLIYIAELLFPFLILGTALNPDNPISLSLELSPLRYIGRLSYSLYLWQQLFFLDAYIWPNPLPLMNRFPLSYLLAFACAMLSFYVIERPAIRVGYKIAPMPAPGAYGSFVATN